MVKARARRARRGYAMLVALILIAIITIIGATSLSIAGVDQRVAAYTRRHVAVADAADAGTQHARYDLMFETPSDEGWDVADTGAVPWVEELESESVFEGETLDLPLGTYTVDATFAKCAAPPPGYSTEEGNDSFRSDYWNMSSHAWFEDNSGSDSQLNASEARATAVVRKVMRGSCQER